MNLLLFNLKTDADDDVLGFTTDWINALADRYDRVYVLTMYAGRVSVKSNVEVYSVGKEKGYSEARRLFEFYRILFKLIRTKQIDVCFAHMMPLFLALAGPVLALKRIPSILWYTHRSVTAVLRAAVFWSFRVVTASRDSCNIRSKKILPIGHGIDTNKFYKMDAAKDHNTFHFMTVSRISPIKRLDIIIDAFAALKSKQPGIEMKLSIVGKALGDKDTVYQDFITDRIKSLDIVNLVEFIGSVPFKEIQNLYQSADCFINVCVNGSYDKALLEAMSCELPVLTTNKAFSEFIARDDFWVIDEDAPEKLADGMGRITKLDKAERAELGRRMREIIIARHNIDNLMDKIISAYKKVDYKKT